MSKKTSAQLDQQLKEKHITRRGPFLRMIDPTQFLCNICNYTWTTKPIYIINVGTGCPSCAGNAPLTNKRFDEKIVGRSITRLENIISGSVKILFGCLNYGCHNKWKSTPHNILIGRGCPKCACEIEITNEVIDIELIGRNIKRLENSCGTNIKINFQCLIDDCQYIWKTKPSHIIDSGSGCPNCSGKCPTTNKIVDKRLEGRSIKRLDDCFNSFDKKRFQCLNKDCGHIWCPVCINKNEKLIYTTLINLKISFIYHKKLIEFNASFPNYIVDFYFPLINTIIEYNGRQHYQPVCFGSISKERAEANFIKQQKRDQDLQAWADANGYTMIWIDGRVYKNKKLEQFIKENILLLLNR